jgi:16S rRNA (cytosine967-C5)-methyltransferase
MSELLGPVKLPYLFYKNASELISGYDGSVPFHLYLKDRFRENKNWGSKDRKRYRACCYWYWRNAVGVSRHNATEILPFLQTHFPASSSPENSTTTESLQQDEIIQPYAPFEQQLSENLDVPTLSNWFQTEPWVWLRAIQGKSKAVKSQLEKAAIEILEQRDHSFAVSAQANLDSITQQGFAYIQDIGSQEAMDWHNLPLQALCNADHTLWDCCSGAGGKSLTLLQNHPQAQVTCSDVRKNILENLQKRFQLHQLKSPKTHVCDLTQGTNSLRANIVLADVPCSGSGTWRRNPENLHFFTFPEIAMYAQKQQAILQQLADSVITGGYLVYLTCSVFKAENEDNISQFLKGHSQYSCVETGFCGGQSKGGDYIYRAVLQRIKD